MAAWILGLIGATVVAAAGGLWVHHRRFVGYHRHKGLGVPLTRWTMLTSELVDFATLGWWHVVGFLRDGLRHPIQAEGRPVLLVHGWTQNATNFWGLRRTLQTQGRSTVAVSMRHRLAPLAWYRRRLERRLEILVVRFPEGLDVVCHSMGGVVFRMVLDRRADLRASIRTVITLGSPHQGTAAVRGIPWVPELVGMKRRSLLLQRLPRLPILLPHARVVAVAGDADTFVYPVSSSLIPGAEGIILPGVGHAGLLTRRSAHDAVVGALSPPDP